MSMDGAIERLLKRDRMVVLAGLAGVTALAWIYLVVSAAGMGEMTDGAGTVAMNGLAMVAPWDAVDFLLTFAMWAVMMVAMMVPSAAPMVLLYAMLGRKQRARGNPLAPVGVFTAGYLAVWSAFSLVATILQWTLVQLALLSPTMVATSPLFGGALLVAAGVYQWTPFKQACLEHCRSPVHFLSKSWRPGAAGAFVMGLHHGAYCVGCCWILMALLFVGGVMNLLWVAAIALFVLIEKAAPGGPLFGRIGGPLLILAGIGVIVVS